MEKVRRPYLTAGLIIDIVVFSIILFAGLTMEELVRGFRIASQMLIPLALFFMLMVGLIFASIGLSLVSKPSDELLKRKGLFITTIVIVCVMILVLLLAILPGEVRNLYVFLLFFSSIAGAVFTLLGYTKEGTLTPVRKVENNQTERIRAFGEITTQLEKLAGLKTLMIIDEAEYQSLRKKLMETLNKI